jgi:hypothetical protein
MTLINLRLSQLEPSNDSEIALRSQVNSVSANVDSFESYANSTFTSGGYANSVVLSESIKALESSNANSSYADSNAFIIGSVVNSRDNLLVYLDGILQHPDQYIVEGNSLTLSNTDPLPKDISVGIRHLQTSNVLISNSSAANATIAANGTIAWDYESKRLYVYDGHTTGGYLSNVATLSVVSPFFDKGFSDASASKTVTAVETLASSLTAYADRSQMIVTTAKYLFVDAPSASNPHTNLKIYDIQGDNKTNPSYVDTQSINGFTQAGYVGYGDTLFYCDGTNLYSASFNGTALSTLDTLSGTSTDGIGGELRLWERDDGNTYLICAQHPYFTIVDISNPSSLSTVQTATNSNMTRAWGVTNKWLIGFAQNGYVEQIKIGEYLDGGSVSTATSSTNSAWRGLNARSGAIITVGSNSYFAWDYFNGVYIAQLYDDTNSTGPVGSTFASTPVAYGTGNYSYPYVWKDDYDNIFVNTVTPENYFRALTFSGSAWTNTFGSNVDDYALVTGVGIGSIHGRSQFAVHDDIAYITAYDSDTDLNILKTVV